MTAEDTDRKHAPSSPEFLYTLVVNDHSDTDTVSTPNYDYPRYGWAVLSWHDPTKPAFDANPYPEEYIQEQTIAEDADNATLLDEDPTTGIAMPTVIHPYRIQNRVGWDGGPSHLYEFIRTVRDEYYEYGIDPESLPVRVVLTKHDDTSSDSPYDETFEIYFRNGADTVEYIMWHSDEFYYPDGVPNSELIQKILVALGDAYEQPEKFLAQWGEQAVQVPSDFEY